MGRTVFRSDNVAANFDILFKTFEINDKNKDWLVVIAIMNLFWCLSYCWILSQGHEFSKLITTTHTYNLQTLPQLKKKVPIFILKGFQCFLFQERWSWVLFCYKYSKKDPLYTEKRSNLRPTVRERSILW